MKNKKKISDHSFTAIFMRIIVVFVIAVWSFTMLYSLFWIVSSSIKDVYDYQTIRFGLPSLEFATLDNYKIAFSKLYVTVYENGEARNVYFFGLLLNSLYVTFVSAFLSIFVPAIVAYATTKYNFLLNKLINLIVVISIVAPATGSLASNLHIMNITGVYNNLFIGVIVLRYGFLGTNFLFMSSAFKGVSNEYREAAFIDGAGHFRVMIQIMFPMIKNIFMMFFLMQVISWWNIWDFTYIYMPSYPNLAQAIYNIQFTFDNQLVVKPVQLATCVIVTVPSLIVFLLFKDQIMQEVSFGGLKG